MNRTSISRISPCVYWWIHLLVSFNIINQLVQLGTPGPHVMVGCLTISLAAKPQISGWKFQYLCWLVSSVSDETSGCLQTKSDKSNFIWDPLWHIIHIYIYIAVPHTDRNSEHWCWVKWMFIPRSQWYLNSFWSIENIGESENGIYTVYPFSIAIQEEQWYVDCISWKIILHYITDKPSCARWSLFAHFKNHENSYIVHHIPPII